MRRVIVWLVLLLAVVAVAQPAQAEPAGQDSVTVDGQDVAFDVEPTVVNWVLMLPVRAVAESLGGEVTWQAETRTAVIRTGSIQVKLTVDSDTAVVNGQKVKLAMPVTIRENRMLVPASFLLTLFGQKVTIHNPALKDPVAISLLEKGRANGLRNIDLQMVQQTTMTNTYGAERRDVSMTTTTWGQVRGDDALVEDSTEINGEKITTASAIRAGKAYSRLAGQPWTEFPASDAAIMLSQQLDSLQMLVQTIREAHLGASRTENGRLQQDVVITFDVAALKAFTDHLLASIPPNPDMQSEIVWESATATLTLDAVTGMTIRGTVDTAVSQRITVGNETMVMRSVMHQSITQTPNDKPIVWPADLPR